MPSIHIISFTTIAIIIETDVVHIEEQLYAASWNLIYVETDVVHVHPRK